MRSGPRTSDRLTAWFLGGGIDVSDDVATQLKNGLYSSVPIFLGGVVNTVTVAAVATWRHPVPAFWGWLLFECVLSAVRLGMLFHGRRAVRHGTEPLWFRTVALSCVWAASVGVGTYLCIGSGDWVLAVIASFSAAAMVCGICLRNFGTPRLAVVMVFLTLIPCALAGLTSHEPILRLISMQLPIYLLTICAASFSLHHLLVSRMKAQSDLEQSELLNATILQSSPDYTIILDAWHRIVFCNRPHGIGADQLPLVGQEWLGLLPPEDRHRGALALQRAVTTGRPEHLLTHVTDADGGRRWFDIIVNQIADDTGRLIVVARDITHQKNSEEQAIWVAQHDVLTGLPNRAVLERRLDAMLDASDDATAGALLLIDVDNFKWINDTLGHDGGDSLLCALATQLIAAVGEGDLVARTGGDEFALLVAAGSKACVERIAERIFAQLREPFGHGGRLVERAASIGASFIPGDGRQRAEIMKAADIALYAAKTGGRGQLQFFEPTMLAEVERHQAMISAARYALQNDRIVPHYQPKMSLRSGRAVGFEALLRWHDRDQRLQGPGLVMAAFDDPALGGPISERKLERVLDDVQRWVRAGLDFGHVALNVTAADFRRGGVAETILTRLDARGLPPSCIQIEITETVFLGRGADDVKGALGRLSDHGIRIALDDFGTGYASLSHLNQFPVHLLKIDRSFIEKIGASPEAEAISATVINLGHCMGLEVVAEGIETPAQQARLIAMGCDTGQGFLYAAALAAAAVPAFLADLGETAARRRTA